MVRAGRGGVYADEFLSSNSVGIGWRDAGDPTAITEKSVLTERFSRAWPNEKPQSRSVGASIVFRFVREVKVGDGIVTYDPTTRTYHTGEITGPAKWSDDAEDYRSTQRTVQWTGTVQRDTLSLRARNTLGSTLTLFLLPTDVAAEMHMPASSQKPLGVLPAVQLEATVLGVDVDPFADIAELAIERIKDRISALDWSAMQELIAALLRSMSYRTTVSPAGPDRGKDIVASPDGFGFEQPRIVVEVKHRIGSAMGPNDVRSFLGGRHKDDRGLYVSTGGFTREAYYEAERATIPLTLMTLNELAKAIVENYDRFDDHGRALLPLTRVYWPV